MTDYFQTEQVIAVLMGSNDTFSMLRTQLLLMEPELTIQRAFSLVAQEFEQRVSTVPPSNIVNATYDG